MRTHHRVNGSNRGMTLIEVIVAVVVLGMFVVLAVGGAQPGADRQAKIARCANNLRLLAAADHCYADDFKEKFFYDWGRPKTLDGKDAGKPKRWWDKDRVGRYVRGVALRWLKEGVTAVAGGLPVPVSPPIGFDAGLGGGVFHCPADIGGLVSTQEGLKYSDAVIGVRSYHQNFWASGISSLNNRDAGDEELLGQFFDRQTDAPINKLILLSEVLSFWRVKTYDDDHIKWATGGEFGSKHRPRARFAGAGKRGYGNPVVLLIARRWTQPVFPVLLDYTRHGGDRIRRPTVGAVNIAYADGHVAWRAKEDLVDPYWGPWTYDTMWSPIDREIDEKVFKGR